MKGKTNMNKGTVLSESVVLCASELLFRGKNTVPLINSSKIEILSGSNFEQFNSVLEKAKRIGKNL